MRDLKSNISAAKSVEPQESGNGTYTGDWIDLRDGNSVALLFYAGNLQGGSVTLAIEDSDQDDHSDAAAVEAGYVDGDLTAMAANETRLVGYGNATTLTTGKPKRYIRGKMVIAGAGADVPVACFAVRGDLRSV